MSKFVKSLSVEVQSCFDAKPRRRRGESAESITDSKALRVCICKDDRQRLSGTDPVVWPDSISISDWFFKKPTSDDKCRRIHVSKKVRGAAQTVNDTDADDDNRRRIADVNTVVADDHTALMDSETIMKAVSSPAAAAAAADYHVSTRTDDDTVVVEYNMHDGST